MGDIVAAARVLRSAAPEAPPAGKAMPVLAESFGENEASASVERVVEANAERSPNTFTPRGRR
ncbi:MAG: hypothetical protein NTW86_30080 [Candidatus Sumerlaeota bacterium]|nr:hypothetical protein [Candidatus Sumerlaeota bacterium]